MSVAAHTLYEKSHPHCFGMPGGVLNTRQSKFTAISPDIVEISGTQLMRVPPAVKLEAAKLQGTRSVRIELDNHFLRDFVIDSLPPAPKGAPQIDVTFDIDANGILKVSAIEKSTGKLSTLTISNEKRFLSKEDVEQLIQAAEDGGPQGTNELPGAEGRKAFGTSHAARVSRGAVQDYWSGLTIQPRRDETQHCTITVQFYHTVSGGVPAPEDVMAAIDDLEYLFEKCEWRGHLAESGADFMKSA
eukprot:g26868.t1